MTRRDCNRGRATADATIQPLERRVLLNAYNVDPTFGDDGIAHASFKHATHFTAALVAEVNPQTVLVVGQGWLRIDDPPARLVMAWFDAQTGQLDQQFGSAGIVSGMEIHRINDAEYLPDGKFLVLGHVDLNYFVARFTSAGALDTTFSGDGIVELDFAHPGGSEGFFQADRIAVAPDGKIVVLGRRGQGETVNETVLARFTPAGVLDSTFDGDGVMTYTNNPYWLANVAVQPDGKVLVIDSQSGTVLRRFTTSGAVDVTFGQNGVAQLPGGSSHSVHPLSDGRILINFDQHPSYRIARLTPQGQLDPTFGDGGTAPLVADMEAHHTGLSFYVAPDGTITAINALGVSRFTTDGQPDPTFGIRGRINNPDHDFVATHVILASDGAVFSTGYTNNNMPSVVLARLTEQADPVFLEIGGRLVVTGTPDADSITIDVAGDQVRVDLNGEVTTYPLADVTSIRLDTDLGDDVINANVPMIDFDIATGGGNDAITSIGGGNHKIDTGAGDDTIVTGEGSDTITAGEGDNSITSGGGNDLISAGSGNDTIDAGAGDDRVFAGAGANSLIGGDGDDYLESGPGDDTILGGAGNDDIRAGTGDNLLDGGDGDDFIKAGEGNDTIHGGDGNDRIYAGDGNNLVFGGTGDDYIQAGSGNDTIWGEIGYDTVKAGDGDDYINGGAGKDRLFGQQGNDTIYAGRADDALDGGPGMDLLKGGDGNDKLWDQDGFADRLFGGLGENIGLWDEDLDEVYELEELLS